MNIDYDEKQELTSYRKVAMASWRHPRDPNTYATLDLPIGPAMAFIRSLPSETPLTLTHFVAKVTANSLKHHTAFNHVMRWGNLYKRRFEDVFITTLLKSKKGNDLSGFIIRDVDSKSLAEVADISKSKVDDLRKNKDPQHQKVLAFVDALPVFLLKPILLVQEFLQYTLNLAIPSLGMPEDRFGSVMITNVGALGVEHAFVPLSPYCRCPLLITIGKPRKIPVVGEHDEIIAVESVYINITFDHRHADGAHGAHFTRRFKKLFSNPQAFAQVFEESKAVDG